MGSGVSFSLLGLLPMLLWLAIAIGLVIAIVMVVRALRSIDRSLQQLVEQGVARGEGPHGPAAD